MREFKSENIAAEDMPIKSLLSNQPREFYQDTDDGLRVTEVCVCALSFGESDGGASCVGVPLLAEI